MMAFETLLLAFIGVWSNALAFYSLFSVHQVLLKLFSKLAKRITYITAYILK